jgi:hypothetical protein
MSGGSYNYAYCTVQDMAESLRRSRDPLRRAFAAHLFLVATAMRNVEWVDSGDYGIGDEVESVRACITPAQEMAEVVQDAIVAIDTLTRLIAEAGR